MIWLTRRVESASYEGCALSRLPLPLPCFSWGPKGLSTIFCCEYTPPDIKHSHTYTQNHPTCAQELVNHPILFQVLGKLCNYTKAFFGRLNLQQYLSRITLRGENILCYSVWSTKLCVSRHHTWLKCIWQFMTVIHHLDDIQLILTEHRLITIHFFDLTLPRWMISLPKWSVSQLL